jgi:calcineurin-like phosphoesterase family protein
MAKWFISDTHFAHQNILKFEAEMRPFKDIDEHDEYLIKMWNALVKETDTIIHLGDVCFKPATKLMEIMPQLNGKKILIRGNHDTLNAKAYLTHFEDVLSVLEDKKNGIIYSHYPLHPSQLEFRYKYNVHGHCHSHTIDDPRYINICVEHTGLAPVHHDYILDQIKHRKVK